MSFPEEFLNKPICIVWQRNGTQLGTITAAHIPYFIEFTDEYGTKQVVPWTSIAWITLNGAKDKAPKQAVPESRDARSKETPKELETAQKSANRVNADSDRSTSEVLATSPVKTEAVSSSGKEPETPHELKAPTPNKAIADLRTMFPVNLEALVEFFDRGSYVEVKPITYLGSDNYRKIASIIKEAGGDYVSAGRNSHFRVPKTERQKQ